MFCDEYTHMKCKCGGIIGMRDAKNFSCDNCGEIYYIGHRGNGWDMLIEDDTTGQIFPMIKRKTK